jgi:hypothetical protein
MGDYSRFLAKMEELKTIEGQYTTLTTTIYPASSKDTLDKYNINVNKNAISNTKPPLVIKPGDDYGEYWKYIGKIENPDPTASTAVANNSQTCWNLATNDPRIFQKVVYTGVATTNPGAPKWDNLCYGLIPSAPDKISSYESDATGYTSMVGNGDGSSGKTHGKYTKYGIRTTNSMQYGSSDLSANLAKADKLYDLQLRINSLSQEIVAESDAGINNQLNELVASAAGSSELISKINQYMNDGVGGIDLNYRLTDKRKELNNVYAEINEQTTLRARKYKFIFYIVITLLIITGYWSYTSKLSLLEQIDIIKNYLGWGWWTNWWIVAIVVIVFIISSFGWDMKGNILMIIRYLSDPEFWTGQLWWVGVTFLMLIVIFLYASFKSFFLPFEGGVKNVEDYLFGSDN